MSSDRGIDTAVTNVSRTDSRNAKTTSTAKASPSRPSVVRSLTDSVINGAWS